MEMSSHKTDTSTSDLGLMSSTEEKMTVGDDVNEAVSRIMVHYVYPAMSTVGLCANVAALAVWSAESAFNSTIFFIKCLAVTDIVLLIIKCPYHLFDYQVQLLQGEGVWLLIIHDYFSTLTVHTTLAIVFIRWLVVYKPLTIPGRLTRQRCVVAYLCLLLWSLLVDLPTVIMLLGAFPDIYDEGMAKDRRLAFIIQTAVHGVSVALPVVLVIFFSCGIVLIVFRQRTRSALSQQCQAHRSRQYHRLLAAVMCISVTTFVSYPLGWVADIICLMFCHELTELCGRKCYLLILRAANFLEVMNSCINFIFYLSFASHFRKRFLQKIQERCCVLRRRPAP